MNAQEELIRNYIAAYNTFDVEGMTRGMASDVVFENIQEGKVTLRLEGIEAFRRQAEEAKAYFSKRTQRVNHITQKGEAYEVEIEYEGVLAIDLPNGPSKGQELRMNGKSIFRIENGEIVHLSDIS